jgi:hypothetical protein
VVSGQRQKVRPLLLEELERRALGPAVHAHVADRGQPVDELLGEVVLVLLSAVRADIISRIYLPCDQRLEFSGWYLVPGFDTGEQCGAIVARHA